MLGWSTQLGNKLFGQDPKLEFRKPGQGADRLAGATIPIDDPYWHQYLTLFDSPSDVVLLLPTSLLLRTLNHNPYNLLHLLDFTSSHLFSLLATPGFPVSRGRDGRDLAKEALNCVRVISRVVPLLLGSQGGAGRDQVEEEVFWRRETIRVEKGEGRTSQGAKGGESRDEPREEGQFIIDDEEDEETASDGESATTPKPTSESAPEADEHYEEIPALAERLLSALIDLLFVPGLTVPEALRQGSDGVVTYVIWEPGIASPPPALPSPPAPLALLSARLEILRLLTLLVSLPSLLTPPQLFPALPNRWRDALVSGRVVADRNGVLCLLCSVVNTACKAAREEDALSSSGASAQAQGSTDLRGAAAKLASAATEGVAAATGGGGAEDVKSLLVGACLQFLGVVMIDHAPAEVAAASPPSSADAGTSASTPNPPSQSPFVEPSSTLPLTSSSTPAPTPPASPNLFAYYLSKLHRTSDLSFLLSGLLSHVYTALCPPSFLPLGFSLPKNPLESPSSPSSAAAGGGKLKSAGWTTEALTVLWRLVDGNRKFAGWLVKERDEGGSGRWSEVVGLVGAVREEWREDETQLGLVRLASFLLQTLTAESALLASASPSHALALKQIVNAPLTAERVGGRLAGVVKRQGAAAGVGEEVGRALSLAEYLIVGAHALILSPSSNRSGRLSTLYPSLVLAIDNLAPFVVELGQDAATRLVRVWLAFSAPSWVLMEEGNPRLVFYLLETFNHIIQHNLSTNPALVQALLQTHKRFELLAHFTLATGVAEARRLRAERRERQRRRAAGSGGGVGLETLKEGEASKEGLFEPTSPRGASPASLSPSPTSPPLSPTKPSASEKALGKRRERTLSLGGLSVAELSLAEPGGVRSPGTDGEEDPPFVGKNGFVPTEEWVSSWRQGLPLDPILILLSELLPRFPAESTPSPSPSPSSSAAATSLLRSLGPSLVPLLPSPPSPPKPPRKFLVSPGPLQTWLASTLYGRIYLAQLDWLRDVVPVHLFAVAHAPPSAGGARRRLSVVGGAIGGLDLERVVGRTVGEVGGRVGDAVRGVWGRVGGGAGGGGAR
ncbi:hypothetical protein JCM1840_006877 [Sporobolomyces johnsonii]